MLRRLWIALALGSAAVASPPADLGSVLEPLRAEYGVPSLAAAITEHGLVDPPGTE